jgi:hypothetical protein
MNRLPGLGQQLCGALSVQQGTAGKWGSQPCLQTLHAL